MTQRTKSKFVFAGPAKSAETLFKWVNVFEQIEYLSGYSHYLLVYLFSSWYPKFWCVKQIHTTWASANSIWWFECGLLWLQSRIQRCWSCHWYDCETRDKANCWNNNLWGAISLFLHAISHPLHARPITSSSYVQGPRAALAQIFFRREKMYNLEKHSPVSNCSPPPKFWPKELIFHLIKLNLRNEY